MDAGRFEGVDNRSAGPDMRDADGSRRGGTTISIAFRGFAAPPVSSLYELRASQPQTGKQSGVTMIVPGGVEQGRPGAP